MIRQTTITPSLRSLLTGNDSAPFPRVEEIVQELWSGYGELLRVSLDNSDSPAEHKVSRIVKQIRIPQVRAGNHPRGWNTEISHQRKIRSYEVELHWYANYSHNCPPDCRVPSCYASQNDGNELYLVLEDLDASGFAHRANPQNVSRAQIESVIGWLAHFHAFYLGESPEGLWESGSYWHLETRPDELNVLKTEDAQLAEAAHSIDQALKNTNYQTLIHGDAKLANFCFSAPNDDAAVDVAAVDFQYVGGGCGMKDLAYFIGSCLCDDACEREEESLLKQYFDHLSTALASYHPSIDAGVVEREWRALYPLAWTDFHRFLKGWSPGHWKTSAYSEKLARKVIEQLG